MRGFSPALLALILGQVCLHSCMAGVRVAAPLLMLNQGHPAWVVGLLLGLFAAAPVTTSLRVGRMADRLGYHRPMHLAVAVGAPTIGVFAQPSGRRWGHDRPPHRVVHAAGRPLDEVVAEAVRVLDEVLDAAATREPASLARDPSALVPESAP